MFLLVRSCATGAGITGAFSKGSSGAGHGGNGGMGSDQSRVGAAYGDLYEPANFGCKGGGSGSLGGGKMKLHVNETLKVDGTIICNAQTATGHYGGGGSGGSIWIVANRIQGYGQVQVGLLSRAFINFFVVSNFLSNRCPQAPFLKSH